MNYYGTSFWSPTDLSHHGVIGMKWGVRRYQNKNGSLNRRGATKAQKDLIKDHKRKKRGFTAGAIAGLPVVIGSLALNSIPIAAVSGVVTLANIGLSANEQRKINYILSTPMDEIYEG